MACYRDPEPTLRRYAVLAVMAVMAIAMMAAANNVGQQSDGKRPDWVAAYAWFTWDPDHIRLGDKVYWDGGIFGFGWLFHVTVQINRPWEIEILWWDKNVIPHVCEIRDVGVRFEDGQYWRTFETWNPALRSKICVMPSPTPVVIYAYVFGEARPRARGVFVGRSQGGISGYLMWAQSVLTVE
jgi:hypothetical protein